ncbi:uncharacterized protein EAF01_004735 [Botrytis porri]|uniref:uncharacterized protein n=1 Tax=Botrytis porri TaxID=87229 RepID=UPI0019023E07|nr:uncharacterized protein EAF01_004735 [Botrytis porri]KAF7907148.1 hypothetical protein EAF01_004735 [Botrytis porri]
MSSHHDDENVHYSEKVGTAEQQKHATRTYTYKSCRRGGKDDESSRKSESKIRIQVRNVSWSPIRASLVRELIGKIYDKDEARSRFGHNNASHTIKWTVDQRNHVAQLYTYDVYAEGPPGDFKHPQGIWMQYNTLLGSGYVLNTTDNPNAREDILNKAREHFVHRRPHPKTIEGDWTYVEEENGEKYKLYERKDEERKHDERVNPHHWTTARAEVDLPWLASARTEIIKRSVTSPYQFGEHKLQVLNDCEVELDVATLEKSLVDYFSIDPHAKKWAYLRITEERNRNGRNNFSISRYHPKDQKKPYHTSSNKKVWITNNTTGQSYQTVHRRLDTTSRFRATVHNESHWKLDWNEKGRLVLKEISNGKSKGDEPSRSRSNYEGEESVYQSSNEYQRGTRPESHSTYRRSPSISSRGGSNQERATDDRHREYRPRSNKSFALSEYERDTRNFPGFLPRRKKYRVATLDSSSGVELDVSGRATSFYQPSLTAGSGSSISSIHTHSRAPTQAEEPKERDRKSSRFNKVREAFSSEYRQERPRKGNHKSRERLEEKQIKIQEREEKKRKDKREKKEEREKAKREKERGKESRQRNNSADSPDWEWNYGHRERAREPSARRKVKLEVTFQKVDGRSRRSNGWVF